MVQKCRLSGTQKAGQDGDGKAGIRHLDLNVMLYYYNYYFKHSASDKP
jgi:hypothetical protein